MTKEGFHWLSILVAAAAFYAVMLDLCEDRQNCVVKASPETFTQDPCVETSKYLEAHYKCRPDEFERQTACEGEELQISCNHGDRIVVYSAMFGRTPNGTDKCRANKQGYIDCQATGALSEVNTHCQGKRSCAIQANESVFGDPCVSGINKYLTVSFACVPKKILKRQHRKANNKKKKKKKKKKGNKGITIETDTSSESTKIHSLGGDNNRRVETSTIYNQLGLPEGNIFTKAPDRSDATRRQQFIDNNRSVAGSETKGSYTKDKSDTTDSSISKHNVNKGNKDMSAEYKTHDSNSNKGNGYQSNVKTDASKESNSRKNAANQPSNQIVNSSQTGSKSNSNNQGHIRENNSAAYSTHNPQTLHTALNSASRNKSKNQISRTGVNPAQTPNSKSANENNAPESPYVTERNLTVLCMNYTRPGVRWGGMVRPKDERTIGFLRDWFSAMYFLHMNQEKAWLYFTLGICFGIIVMLVVVLVKVCINFRRNIRARLDVSEPTHRNAHTNNHSSLDAPMLEHSDSMDRIEVVRFSPRNTLRSHRSNSHHRDLVNYYG